MVCSIGQPTCDAPRPPEAGRLRQLLGEPAGLWRNRSEETSRATDVVVPSGWWSVSKERKWSVVKAIVSVAVVLTLVALVAGSAWALEKPRIETPKDGDVLGPSYDITGSMPYKAFLVVVTDCVRTDTGEVLRSVPGIRHWTNADGTFHFRCASPRVSIGDQGLPLVYRVRAWETNRQGECGPETTVTCRMAQ